MCNRIKIIKNSKKISFIYKDRSYASCCRINYDKTFQLSITKDRRTYCSSIGHLNTYLDKDKSNIFDYEITN